ncbi:MAG: DMT family transporter [Pseudomonadota bacterium]
MMPSPADRLPLGIGAILGTVLALSLGDALIKALGGRGDMGIWQLFLVRSALAFPVLLIEAALLFGPGALRPQAPGWIALRSVLLVAMWIAYYVSLPLLPLAVAAAAYYTLPLFIVLFAALFGGERVVPRQIVGVCLGFVGVWLILRPGGDAFQWAAVLPIGAAVLYAAAMILTRTLCRADHPATLALGLKGAFILFGAAGLAVGQVWSPAGAGFLNPAWAPMGAEAWRNIAVLAALILVASVGTAVTYQAAPASVIGAFDFACVGFALIWGAAFFDERLDGVGLAGIALFVAAGLLAVRRG